MSVVILAVMAGWLVWPGAAALAAGGVRISQLQTGSATSASDEFVELHNPDGAAVPVSGWSLQYHSVGGDCTKSWSKKADLTDAVPAGGYFLLSAKDYLTAADVFYNAGLAATGGSVRVMDAAGTEVDALAWGTGTCGHGTAAAAPAGGQSLQRVQDTGANAADFNVNNQPQPKGTSYTQPAPAPAAAAPTETAPVISFELSELLVNPAAPQTDSQDEFVEIHNTGQTTANLAGFKLKTASDSYGFGDLSVPAGGYATVKSSVSHLALVNSGGSLTLLGPADQTVDSTDWDEATPGASWAVVDGVWQWTMQPTPGAANIAVPLPATENGGGSAPVTSPSPAPVGGASVYPPLTITELLPDPAAPQTDANDEFIELFNPGSVTVSLAGYQLRSGKSLTSSYNLPDSSISPGGYMTFMSAQTHLSLANDGSSVALFDPLGTQIGATVTYPAAKPGQAYVLINGGWAWSTSPTPGSANILAVPATVAKATAKATAGVKQAAAKSTKTSSKKTATKAASTTAGKASTKPVGTVPSPGLGWLLVALAGVTIGYVVYEFRHDVIGYYQRFAMRAFKSSSEEKVIENSHS